MNGARLKLIHHFRQNTLSSQEPRQIKGKCTREEVEINLQKIRMTNYTLAAMSKEIAQLLWNHHWPSNVEPFSKFAKKCGTVFPKIERLVPICGTIFPIHT